MIPDFSNLLAPWQWLLLAAVPPAIIALYFLKLRRQPLEVPSTFLWQRAMEDLHVNSLWQRLRQNLLLLLQLLVLALVMVALVRPTWQGARLTGERFVLLVDNSASMQARDGAPTRLDSARQQALRLIDQMPSGAVAMVVSFADRARVEQPFTDNRRQLRRAVDRITPTFRGSSLTEALQVAAGLANPGRTSSDNRDVQVAEALPATVYILSDGRFPDVTGFSLGNLRPVYLPIGRADTPNVAIGAFDVRPHPALPDRWQAFVRLHQYQASPRAVAVSLSTRDDQQQETLLDSQQVQLPADGHVGLTFDLQDLHEGALVLRAEVADPFPADNAAWVVVNPPRPARVLLVTPGNRPLQTALSTPDAQKHAVLELAAPDLLTTPDYASQVVQQKFDLIVFDRCRPPQAPSSNAVWIGTTPPGDAWQTTTPHTPHIVDADAAHPLMQLLQLWDVDIAQASVLQAPAGARTLLQSQVGPIMAIAPRDNYQDLVLGFDIVQDEQANTNWPLRLSFPLFALNLLDHLAGGNTTATLAVTPGRPVELRSSDRPPQIQVQLPDRRRVAVNRTPQGTYPFTATELPGIYQVQEPRVTTSRLAVNLFDPQEQSLAVRPQGALHIGYVKVDARPAPQPAVWQAWKWLLLLALAVLTIEWYIYNRRVYI